MYDKEKVRSSLPETGRGPSSFGQHFLVDKGIADRLYACVDSEAAVIEVGSGLGNLTEDLLGKAKKVIGIEIDRRFEPALQRLAVENVNLTLIFKDVLKLDFPKLVKRVGKSGVQVQVVANLPFQITEPFLSIIAGSGIDSAALILGKKAACEIKAGSTSVNFGRMSVIAQTFFGIQSVVEIPKEAFYPAPKTEAEIVYLTAKDRHEIQENPENYALASLVRNADNHRPVIEELSKIKPVDVETISKTARHQRERSRVRREIRYHLIGADLGGLDLERGVDRKPKRIMMNSSIEAYIPSNVLNRNFNALNNYELSQLVEGLRYYYQG